MRDPINERDRSEAPRGRAATAIGAAVVVVALLCLFLPLLIPLGGLAKYFVVLALLGMFLGAGFVLNGAVDWWRGR